MISQRTIINQNGFFLKNMGKYFQNGFFLKNMGKYFQNGFFQFISINVYL